MLASSIRFPVTALGGAVERYSRTNASPPGSVTGFPLTSSLLGLPRTTDMLSPSSLLVKSTVEPRCTRAQPSGTSIRYIPGARYVMNTCASGMSPALLTSAIGTAAWLSALNETMDTATIVAMTAYVAGRFKRDQPLPRVLCALVFGRALTLFVLRVLLYAGVLLENLTVPSVDENVDGLSVRGLLHRVYDATVFVFDLRGAERPGTGRSGCGHGLGRRDADHALDPCVVPFVNHFECARKRRLIAVAADLRLVSFHCKRRHRRQGEGTGSNYWP